MVATWIFNCDAFLMLIGFYLLLAFIFLHAIDKEGPHGSLALDLQMQSFSP